MENFEFVEQEQYTLEDVQAIINDFKVEVSNTIKTKDETIVGLTTQVEKVKELEESNHLLNIKNLAISNGLDDTMFDLINDNDIEVVKTKIELVKGLQANKNIDNSYKPTDKRKDDDIAKLEKDGNVAGMLKLKVSKMFQ